MHDVIAFEHPTYVKDAVNSADVRQKRIAKPCAFGCTFYQPSNVRHC
jgi:hypothetical protein